MKHLLYSWSRVSRMRGVFHICMILQISENSVAVKNIISKIMVLFRREISLSTQKEKRKKKRLQLFSFFSQFCPALLRSPYHFVGHTSLFLWPFPIWSWKKLHFLIHSAWKGCIPSSCWTLHVAGYLLSSSLGLNVLSWIKEDGGTVF